MKRMPQEDKMTDNTKRSRGRKNPLLLLFLLLACLAALACLAGCGRSRQSAAGSVNEADLQSAQSRENFTVSLASVTDGGECRSVEWKAAGDKYCLTEDGFSTYYQKTDGVYERRTEDDEDWTNTRKDDIGACLDGCFPLYGAFFGREAVFASFDADGDTLSARASLLEALSGAELEVVSLQVRLADGKFYTASAEARRGDEAVTVEYLFHAYGTTEVELPGIEVYIFASAGDFTAPDFEGEEVEIGFTPPDNSEVIWAEGGLEWEEVEIGDISTDIVIVPPIDPGINEPPVIVGVIGDSGNIGDIVGDISIVGPDDGGNGDSGDIEIVDPDDGIFDLFPKENEPAIEPPGFPEGNEPDTEDPIDPDYGGTGDSGDIEIVDPDDGIFDLFPEENEPAIEDPIDPDYGGLIVFDPTVRLP